MKLLDDLKQGFERLSDASDAVKMSAYMKNKFPYYGIKSPKRREVVSKAWANNKITDDQELYTFIEEAWARDEREWQYAAMDIMGKCKKLFSEKTIIFAEKLILTKSWWDTVDWLSSHVVGHCFKTFPDQKLPYIEKWIKSDNIWLLRSCLIFQLKYKEDTDFELMKELIVELMGSKEFFIRKGAGWALRQYSKFRPGLVKEFIESNPDLSPLTKREGLKYC